MRVYGNFLHLGVHMLTFFTVLGNFLTLLTCSLLAPCLAIACPVLCLAIACQGCEGGRSLFTWGCAGCFYYLMLRYFHTNFQKSFPWSHPPQGAAQGMHERQNINEISWRGGYPSSDLHPAEAFFNHPIDNAIHLCYTIRVR